MLKFSVLLLLVLLLAPAAVPAKNLQREKEIAVPWCLAQGGTPEVRLSDGSVADCETEEYIYEVDFAPKFKEAIGQAIHYSVVSGKKAGILLIIEKPAHWKYYRALLRDLRHKKLYVRVWYLRTK